MRETVQVTPVVSAVEPTPWGIWMSGEPDLSKHQCRDQIFKGKIHPVTKWFESVTYGKEVILVTDKQKKNTTFL